jgi:putative ABC transport system permease protein
MQQRGWAVKDMMRNPFRTAVVVLCALLVAGLSLATALIVNGTGVSLDQAQTRFGADLIVVPEGAERETQGALLMAVPMQAWMASDKTQAIAAVPGVAQASPQLYVGTFGGLPGSGQAPLFLVAYEPSTDFAVRPWLPDGFDGVLDPGETIAGSSLTVEPDHAGLESFGLTAPRARLHSTGTSLDDTLLISFATVQQVLQSGQFEAQQGYSVPEDSISSILVKLTAGAEAEEVAESIRSSVPGVTPISSPDLFASFRDQLAGQTAGMYAILVLVLILSLGIITLVFSMVVNQRRREIGVLRALGATRATVIVTLLGSAAILALIGGVAGIILGGLVVYAFRTGLGDAFGFPFQFPSPSGVALLVVIGLAVALVAVLLAALVPAYRVARQEPAVSMRE